MSYVLALNLIGILVAIILTVMRSHRAADHQPMKLNTPSHQSDPELAMKKPFFRREVVEAKVRSLFPQHARGKILRLLDEYVPLDGGEPERVQLAILKLSDGNLEKLRSLVEAAKRDFREAIVPAEYPEQSKDGFVGWAKVSEAEKQRISNEDNRQYMDWLENDTPRI